MSGGNPKDELIAIFFLIEKKRNLFGFLLTYSYLGCPVDVVRMREHMNPVFKQQIQKYGIRVF